MLRYPGSDWLIGGRPPRGGGVSPLAAYASGNGALPTIAVHDLRAGRAWTGETEVDLSTVFTYVNASGAALAMVDSDGVTKAQPHNLLLQSSNLAQTWLPGGAAVIDGSDQVSFTAATADNLRQLLELTPGGIYTTSLDIWSVTNAGEDVQVQLFVTGVANGLLDVTLSDTPTRVSLDTDTAGGTDMPLWRLQNNLDGLAKTIRVRAASLYISPMVNNPTRGDDHVPTTTAPAFLPRLGHHVDLGAGLERVGLLFAGASETYTATNVPDGTFDIEIVEADGTVTPFHSVPVTGGYSLSNDGNIAEIRVFEEHAI
jgi:hypothetical protein